jgi:hypothetical protein
MRDGTSEADRAETQACKSRKAEEASANVGGSQDSGSSQTTPEEQTLAALEVESVREEAL